MTAPYRWREWKAAVRAAAPERGIIATANGLVLFASHTDGTTTVGLDTLCEETGLARGTTINHLRWLTLHGLLCEVVTASGRTLVLTTPGADAQHAGVRIALQRADRTVACTLQCDPHASGNAAVHAAVRSSRGDPYEPQEPQERSQPAGERAPTHALTREGQPDSQPDPWAAVTAAVLAAYANAVEKRTGGASRGRALPLHAAEVVTRVREALPPDERDDPDAVTDAAERVTTFFAAGFPHDRAMPPLWRLGVLDTFAKQWDMAEDGTPAASATPSGPHPKTREEIARDEADAKWANRSPEDVRLDDDARRRNMPLLMHWANHWGRPMKYRHVPDKSHPCGGRWLDVATGEMIPDPWDHLVATDPAAAAATAAEAARGAA